MIHPDNESFRQLADFIPQLAWMADETGSIFWYNQRWYDYTGTTLEEMKGWGWQKVHHPDEVERVVEKLRNSIAQGTEWEDTFPLRSKEGEYRWFLSRARPVKDEEGKIIRWFGTNTDITAQRESEKIYRAIGESINYGIWVCDREGNNVYASQSFLDLVGMTQEECSAFGWTNILHPDDAEETIALWQECVRTGTHWDKEHRFRGADGQWHYILARGVPIRNELGEITGWAGINLDIGDLKKSEQALIEADRRKDEFLATLAHEIRNPLAPISNALYLLRAGNADKALKNEALAMAERQLKHLIRLVDDLMDVSRITHGKIGLQKEKVNLSDILSSAMETAKPLIKEKHQALETRDIPQSLWLYADPVRLAQTFANLLNNAAKYTAEGGVISIEVEKGENKVTVHVRDTGIGIAPEVLENVFNLFAQADNSVKRAYGGLGIGLTLVKELVALHGGSVTAASPGIGKGSVFSVTLPLAGAPDQKQAAEPSGKGGADGSALQILIVDDNAASAQTVGMGLELLGHKIHLAYSGAEALKLAAELKPDVILLDIGLPHMDGYEVCRALRSMPELEDKLIIAQTGWGQEEHKKQSREAGFDHHLVKPVDLETLQVILNDA